MPTCILCGQPAEFRFSSRDYANTKDTTERRLNWCETCNFGRIEGDFSPNDIEAFYPRDYYTHKLPKPAVGKGSISDRIRTRIALALDRGPPFDPLELPPGKTACDIGCGGGFKMRQLKSAGYEVVGIDPDPMARTAAASSGEVFNGTAENLPTELRGRTFDVVMMSHVLEHCIDPVKAIANAKSLLGERGVFVIEVPNNDALGFSMFKAAWPWSDIPRHLNFFTHRSLDRALHDNGLTIRKTNYVGYTRQFASWWIDTQKSIWAAITDNSPSPNFRTAAWILLLKSSVSSRKLKYDSVRVHATRNY